MIKIKSLISIFVSFLFIVSTPLFTYASSEMSDNDQIEYEETHEQINFDNLSFLVIDKTNIVVDIDPTISVFKKTQAKKEKEKYDLYVKNNPNIAKILSNIISSGKNICVLSYTQAPVVEVDNHYERVEKEDYTINSLGVYTLAAPKAEVSDPSKAANGNFELTTIVTRSGNSNPYTYTALTMGLWDTGISPALTGKNRPGGGRDFILQSCPTVTSTSDFSCEYNYATNGQTSGQEGVNYFETDGSDSWVEFSVEDDPLGLAQLESFGLTQTFKAKATSRTKKINSYYIHTWQTMNISVSVSGVAGAENGEPSAQVGLIITPSKEEKQWPLHNSVSYNW